MKSEYRNVTDFIGDPSFRDFVLNANPTDQRYWENWIKNHPDKITEVQLAMDFIRTKHAENMELDPGAFHTELQRFMNHLQAQGAREAPHKKQTPFFISKPVAWLRLAAVVSVLVVSTFILYRYVEQAPHEPATQEIAFVEKVNPKGQKSSFTLPDGSTVKLNADSRLIFPNTFSAHMREVTLEGEAFFEVTENPDRPFIVKTSQLHTRVLGTSFNVRAYRGENRYEVALLTGKVRITDQADTSAAMILSPNELAVYNHTDKNISKTRFDPEVKLAWKNNTIYFDNSDFTEIIKTLERWYGVDFILPEELEIQDRFTGRYQDKSLWQVLQGISFSLDFQFEIDNKTVTIKQ